MLVGTEQRRDPICAQMERSPLVRELDLPGPSILGFLACAAVVRREAFLAVDGFDDVVFFCGEEERVALDLAAAGWGLAYVDEVVAHHHPSPARDLRHRQVLAARNALLTAVLRRPWPVVASKVVETARSGGIGRSALAAVLPRLPRAVANRRALPARVEAARWLLESPPRDGSVLLDARLPNS